MPWLTEEQVKRIKESTDFRLDGQNWKSAYTTPTCSYLSAKGLLVIRILLAVTWLSCVVWSILDWRSGLGYWLTKLTHMGAIVELAYFVFAAVSTYMALYGEMEDGTGTATPWFVRATWFLFSFAPVVSLMVFILYWGLVYRGGPLSLLSLVMHGGNFALVTLDFLVARQPFYFVHVYMPIAFSAAYSLFTLVYYLAGGLNEDGVSKYIYASIDWRTPVGTAILLGFIVLGLVPLVYAATFCICGPLLPCWTKVKMDNTSDDGEGADLEKSRPVGAEAEKSRPGPAADASAAAAVAAASPPRSSSLWNCGSPAACVLCCI